MFVRDRARCSRRVVCGGWGRVERLGADEITVRGGLVEIQIQISWEQSRI